MSANNLTTLVLVDATPEQAFAAINKPQEWWGRDIEGGVGQVGSDWTYRYKDMHQSTQRTAELEPGRRIVWDVVEARMSFLRDQEEWKGSRIVFDIAPKGDKTEIRFTHIGLVPGVECFDICKNAWTGLIGDSLRKFIESGEGLPDIVE